MGTNVAAFATAGTFCWGNQYPGDRILAFGIVAPSAGQIASLEKHGGTNAGTIHKGAPLNIKNGGSLHKTQPFWVVRLMMSS